MGRHADAAGVQEAACGALHNLSFDDANRKRAIDTGAAALAEAARRRHSSHGGVQEYASRLLDRLRE